MGSLSRRRQLLQGSDVPSSIQLVEYIDILNTSQSYHDNRVEFSSLNSFNFYTKFSFQVLNDPSTESAFAGYYSSGGKDVELRVKSRELVLWNRKEGRIFTYNIPNIEERIDLEYTSTDGNFSDVKINGQSIVFNPVSSQNFYFTKIGCYRTDMYPADTRIFGCQIFNNDIMKLNLLPAYDRNTFDIGFYDTVSSQLLTNLGQGNFIKGDDIYVR